MHPWFIAQMHYKPFDRIVNIEFGYREENYLYYLDLKERMFGMKA